MISNSKYLLIISLMDYFAEICLRACSVFMCGLSSCVFCLHVSSVFAMVCLRVPLAACTSTGVPVTSADVKNVPTFFPRTTSMIVWSAKPSAITTPTSCSSAHVAALTCNQVSTTGSPQLGHSAAEKRPVLIPLIPCLRYHRTLVASSTAPLIPLHPGSVIPARCIPVASSVPLIPLHPDSVIPTGRTPVASSVPSSPCRRARRATSRRRRSPAPSVRASRCWGGATPPYRGARCTTPRRPTTGSSGSHAVPLRDAQPNCRCPRCLSPTSMCTAAHSITERCIKS